MSNEYKIGNYFYFVNVSSIDIQVLKLMSLDEFGSNIRANFMDIYTKIIITIPISNSSWNSSWNSNKALTGVYSASLDAIQYIQNNKHINMLFKDKLEELRVSKPYLFV